MKIHPFATIAAFCFVLAGCAGTTGTSSNPSSRNFAAGIYQATMGQIQIAQQRASHFFQGLSSEKKEEAKTVRYLAVRTADPTPAQMEEIKKDIARPHKKSSGGTGYGTVATGGSQTPTLPKVYCVMIWDTQTQQVVGEKCYAVLDLPQSGMLAKFDVYTAQYVGVL